MGILSRNYYSMSNKAYQNKIDKAYQNSTGRYFTISPKKNWKKLSTLPKNKNQKIYLPSSCETT